VRVYFVTSSYPRHSSDHAGSFVHAQVKHLAELGVDPEVFCWADKLEATLEVPWPVHRVNYAPSDAQYLFYGRGAPENLTRYPSLGVLAVPAIASMIATLAKSPKPDLIVGHWYAPAGFIARTMATIWGVPAVVVGHSGGIQLLARLPAPVASAVMRWITAGVSTAVSDPLREIVRQYAPGADVRVMPMGIEIPATCEREPSSARSGALFLGRLEPIKGVDIAIRAARRAGWTLRVAGEGSMHEQVARSGAEFLGFVGGAEKWAAIDSAEVSLHPSVPQAGRHEGLPVSLLECAARATVPFVSGVPGVERWLAEPHYQVRRAGDPADFAKALEWWSSLSPKKQNELAEAQRARVEPLRWEHWSREWLSLFDEELGA
jgi:glycosyltransferase involved in cell wall biosynthesis